MRAATHSRSYPMDQRRRLVDASVTLDGERAKITGRCLDFPRVVNVRTGAGFEWSWQAVERVVDIDGGRFRS